MIPGIPGKPVTIQDCLTAGHEFYSQELVEMYTERAVGQGTAGHGHATGRRGAQRRHPRRGSDRGRHAI